MKAKEFLELLENEDVKNALGAIVEESVKRENSKSKNSSFWMDVFHSYNNVNGKLQRVKDQLAETAGELRRANVNVAKLESQISGLKSTKTQLEYDQEQLRNSYNDLNCRFDNLNNEKNKLEQDNMTLNNEVSSLQQFINELKNDNVNKESVIKKQNSEIDELKTKLEQRFADGWELYQAYQNLSEEIKNQMKNFIVDTSFESFICSGAKDRTIPEIWDTCKYCVAHNYDNEKKTLWGILEYMLQLVNATLEEENYGFAADDKGYPYDENIHDRTQDSQVQGIISETYLLGIWNYSQGKWVRKSYVRV